MHQYSRPPPVTASPANSPRTNPTRTNNSREEGREFTGKNSGATATAERGGNAVEAAGRDKETMTRLDQVIQVNDNLI